MVEHLPSKQIAWVRFPSGAPIKLKDVFIMQNTYDERVAAIDRAMNALRNGELRFIVRGIESDAFLKACDANGIRWADGDVATAFRPVSSDYVVQYLKSGIAYMQFDDILFKSKESDVYFGDILSGKIGLQSFHEVADSELAAILEM